MSEFISIAGNTFDNKRLLTDHQKMAKFCLDPRGNLTARPLCVIQPVCLEEVRQIVLIARKTKTALVPQSGNTGLVGGQLPDDSHTQAIISFALMNKIKDVDTIGNTITAEAGVILHDLRATAIANHRYLPISIASQGSCQLGGIIASNAGGSNVLAHGNTRELVLGVEAVLADGSIWRGLRQLRKDNSGYDLRHLLIGSEGTLGLITAATLRLSPLADNKAVAFIGFDSLVNVRTCFLRFRDEFGHLLTAFELISDTALNFVSAFNPHLRNPLPSTCKWYCLLELATTVKTPDLSEAATELLADLNNNATVIDATIARSNDQRQRLWQIRESISPAQKSQGKSLKHDISVPIAAIVEFIHKASAELINISPQARPVIFGHMGDGNIHFNISQPLTMSASEFMSNKKNIENMIYNMVLSFGGSISAEHGIGQIKRQALGLMHTSDEINSMRRLKTALDPENLFNPGKIL